MAKRFWGVIEWLGRIETLHVLLTSDFVRTLLLPTVGTVIGAATGILGGVPLMWVLVGSSLMFMAITQSLLRADEYKERKNPQNKLKHQIVFQYDLEPAEMPFLGNRQQRRVQKAQGQPARVLGANEVNPYLNRALVAGQLGVELTNIATFPISCILQSAETDIEGIEPPRSAFPKSAAVVPAGDKIRIVDDRIQLEKMSCHRLTGNIDLLIKYGLPGKEHFELHVKGGVDIVMEKYGLVSQVILSLI